MKKQKFFSLVVILLLLTTIIQPQTFAEPKAPNVLLDAKHKTPRFISERWTHPSTKNKRTILWSYLKAKQSLFRLTKDVQSHFRILKEEKDRLGFTHFRLQQIVHGVKVYGADQTIHLNPKNQVTAYVGQFYPNLEQKHLPTAPTLSKQAAIEIAKKDLGIKNSQPTVKTDLWIYPHQNRYYLAYEIKLSTIQPKPGYWHYYIDATNGNIIHKFNAIHPIKGFGKGVFGDNKTFEITCEQGERSCFLYDQTRGKGIKTHDAQNQAANHRSLPGPLISSPSIQFHEPAGVDAHTYLSKTFDYFKQQFNRNSYDNNGAPIVSSVHVGNQWSNAAWNGEQILFGDGDGRTFTNFAASLDIAAHELTHAVIEHTANLRYWGEPGALNESLSDIFAVMVDPDWLIGEDVYIPRNSKAIRSLKDPTQYNQPDHYRNRYKGFDDNGGVHINSGIHNKAAYLLMDGGTHNGVTVQKIGKPKTAQIYYRTLTHYLTTTSDFSQMRRAAIQATTDLFGAHSPEVTAVQKAYDAVGIK